MKIPLKVENPISSLSLWWVDLTLGWWGWMGRGWKRWKGVEGWNGGRGGKRGVCVWNQVAGSCILSGVAGHTLPHWHFTAMQCIGIIRLELQAIKYPPSALRARVYNFSKSFSYVGAQRFSTSCNARLALACRSVLPALQCVGKV